MDYEWKPVVGYEGIYEVRQGTDGGCVRRVAPVKRSRVGKELRSFDSSGYARATLSKPGAAPKLIRLHELIMAAFGPPRPSLNHVIRHLDDVKLNNVMSNLVWGTKSENLKDAWGNGRRAMTVLTGEQHPNAKLTDAEVLTIRSSTETGTALSERFSISPQTVSRIRRGLARCHI